MFCDYYQQPGSINSILKMRTSSSTFRMLQGAWVGLTCVQLAGCGRAVYGSVCYSTSIYKYCGHATNHFTGFDKLELLVPFRSIVHTRLYRRIYCSCNITTGQALSWTTGMLTSPFDAQVLEHAPVVQALLRLIPKAVTTRATSLGINLSTTGMSSTVLLLLFLAVNILMPPQGYADLPVR